MNQRLRKFNSKEEATLKIIIKCMGLYLDPESMNMLKNYGLRNQKSQKINLWIKKHISTKLCSNVKNKNGQLLDNTSYKNL
jgi:hypothetical protein